jgi:hypothetical protein
VATLCAAPEDSPRKTCGSLSRCAQTVAMRGASYSLRNPPPRLLQPLRESSETKKNAEYVCSHRSASQDTLRNCTKCRGILAHTRLQALSRVETNEASSRELIYCAQLATHDLAPPFRRPCGRQHKGISIKNNNQGEQSVVAAVSTRSVSSHPRLRSHSHLVSSNPKELPKMGVGRPPAVAVRRPPIVLYDGLHLIPA